MPGDAKIIRVEHPLARIHPDIGKSMPSLGMRHGCYLLYSCGVDWATVGPQLTCENLLYQDFPTVYDNQPQVILRFTAALQYNQENHDEFPNIVGFKLRHPVAAYGVIVGPYSAGYGPADEFIKYWSEGELQGKWHFHVYL